MLKIAYILLHTLLIIDIALVSMNMGHDIGYKAGYNDAILQDKLKIECTFSCRPGRTRDHK